MKSLAKMATAFAIVALPVGGIGGWFLYDANRLEKEREENWVQINPERPITNISLEGTAASIYWDKRPMYEGFTLENCFNRILNESFYATPVLGPPVFVEGNCYNGDELVAKVSALSGLLISSTEYDKDQVVRTYFAPDFVWK